MITGRVINSNCGNNSTNPPPPPPPIQADNIYCAKRSQHNTVHLKLTILLVSVELHFTFSSIVLPEVREHLTEDKPHLYNWSQITRQHAQTFTLKGLILFLRFRPSGEN